jgi:hypothetical protein
MHGQMLADTKAASNSAATPLIISPKVWQIIIDLRVCRVGGLY